MFDAWNYVISNIYFNEPDRFKVKRIPRRGTRSSLLDSKTLTLEVHWKPLCLLRYTSSRQEHYIDSSPVLEAAFLVSRRSVEAWPTRGTASMRCVSIVLRGLPFPASAILWSRARCLTSTMCRTWAT